MASRSLPGPLSSVSDGVRLASVTGLLWRWHETICGEAEHSHGLLAVIWGHVWKGFFASTIKYWLANKFIVFIRENVPEPSESEDITEAGISISAVQLFAPFSSLFKLPPSSGGVGAPVQGSDLPCFPPQELQAESVSLNTNTSLQERKTMLGTGRDQVCIPQSTSCDGGAERRKGERTTRFRNPSSFTDWLCVFQSGERKHTIIWPGKV